MFWHNGQYILQKASCKSKFSCLKKQALLTITKRKYLDWLTQEGEHTGYDLESLSYYNDDSLESCASASIILCGLIMLVAPPWWLLLVQDKTKQLAIITGFIVLFLALLATLSAATPFESLAATAAYVHLGSKLFVCVLIPGSSYSAVLMVFMQVGNGT